MTFRKLSIAAFAAAQLAAAQAAEVDVRVILSSEIAPGVYGRVDIGPAPPPPVLYAKPVVIVRERHVAPPPPIYMHVPPGHAKNWRKHCHKYGACNRPVYFVVSEEYGRGKGKKKGRKD